MTEVAEALIELQLEGDAHTRASTTRNVKGAALIAVVHLGWCACNANSFKHL